MAARDTAAGHLAGVVAPDCNRIVDAADQSLLPPQDEHWTDDFAIGVGGVVLKIDRGRGAIVLAGRVEARWITETSQVLGKRLGRKGISASPCPDIAQVVFRITADERLGQAAWLDEKEPMIVGGRDEFIKTLEDLGSRNDVEHGSADDTIGIIEA